MVGTDEHAALGQANSDPHAHVEQVPAAEEVATGHLLPSLTLAPVARRVHPVQTVAPKGREPGRLDRPRRRQGT